MHERFEEIEYLRKVVDSGGDSKECRAIKKIFNETVKNFSEKNWPRQD